MVYDSDVVRRILASGVPKAHAQANLDLDDDHPSVDALEAARNFVDTFDRRIGPSALEIYRGEVDIDYDLIGRGLYLYGSRSSARRRTFIACAVLNAVLATEGGRRSHRGGYRGKYVWAEDLMEEMRSAVGLSQEGNHDEANEVFQRHARIFSVDALVVDGLGVGSKVFSGSGWAVLRLMTLYQRRFHDGLPTITTSYSSPEDFGKYDDSFYSLLNYENDVVLVGG